MTVLVVYASLDPVFLGTLRNPATKTPRPQPTMKQLKEAPGGGTDPSCKGNGGPHC